MSDIQPQILYFWKNIFGQNMGLEILILVKFRGKIKKNWAPVISSVGKLQLFGAKIWNFLLPTFLTHDAPVFIPLQ